MPSDRIRTSLLRARTLERYKDIFSRIETSGEAFLSNTVADDKFELRACIVNFRTSLEDVEALPELIVRIGRAIDAESRAKTST